MTAAPALIAHVAPAMDQPVLLALTAGGTETLRPACLLQSRLAILLGAVELDELGKRLPCLKLDTIHGHGKHSRYMRTSSERSDLLTRSGRHPTSSIPSTEYPRRLWRRCEARPPKGRPGDECPGERSQAAAQRSRHEQGMTGLSRSNRVALFGSGGSSRWQRQPCQPQPTPNPDQAEEEEASTQKHQGPGGAKARKSWPRHDSSP